MTVGHVHGRFQPFHEEHLDYAAWAASESEELIVGITNADAAHTTTEDAEEKRHEPKHNPFEYHERHRMISAAIDESGISVPVHVMPFPINRPDLWDAYAPVSARYYINVLEPWHEVKADRIRDHGRRVRTKDGTRTISGTAIRERMARGDDSWRRDVPDATARVVDEIDGVERVRERWD